MRNLFIFLLVILATGNATAQTKVQRGIARMITHSANDPIVPVAGVQVVVGNVANKASDKNGRFSMNIAVNNEQSYQVADVRLPKGSTLLLASPSKKKKLFLSKNDLEVALITSEDKNTVSKATYRKLLKKYNQQAEQLRLLRTQLEEQQLDLEENSSEYAQLKSRIDSIQGLLNQYFDEKNRENTTKEIERIAEELTLTDYQSLKEEDAHIYDLMKEGDWPTLSAYLLKLMNGDAAAYVQEAVDQKNAAKEVYDKASQELAHRLERIEDAIESFKMQHLNDSVSNYYEILIRADSTDFDNLIQAGQFEQKYMAHFDRARSYFEIAQRHAEADTLKAICYNNLGSVYDDQDYHDRSEVYYQRALKILLAVHGEQHPEVAISYNNLGFVCSSQGDFAHAEEYYRKALDIRLSLYGDKHPTVAMSYNNLGSVCSSQGVDACAILYYQIALKILISMFGEQHYDVALLYNNIGEFYRKKNDYVKAEIYHQKALKIWFTIFGEQHQNVAISYNNIGLACAGQGNYICASEYYLKALKIFCAVFGEQHSKVALSYNNLGCLYYEQADYPKAEEYQHKALKILLAIFGGRHSDVATSYYNLGSIYYCQNNYARAEEYFQKALDIAKNVLGESHPKTKIFQENFDYVKSKLKEQKQ